MGAAVDPAGIFGWSWQLLAAGLMVLVALALLASLLVRRKRWTRTRILLSICFLMGAPALAGFSPVPGLVPRVAPVSADARYYTAAPLRYTLTPQGAVSPSTLLALSTRSGAVRWRYHVATTGVVSVLGASQTAVVVYDYDHTSPHAHVVALDDVDGHALWSFDVGAPGEIPLAQLLPGASMLVIGDASQIVGVALATGVVRWRYAVPATMRVTSPLLIIGDTILVRAATEFAPPDNPGGVRLFALGTQDGALHWHADLGPVARVGSTMAASGQVVCAEIGSARPGSSGPGTYAYDFGLAAFDVTTGATLWQRAFAEGEVDPNFEVVLASAATCFVIHRQSLLALDAGSGALRFTFPGSTISVPGGASVWLTSGLAEGDTLFVAAAPAQAGVADIATVYALRATDGRLAWRFQTSYRTNMSTVTLAISPERGNVFVSPVGQSSGLTALSPADGHVLWTTSRQLTSTLAPAAAVESPDVTFVTEQSPICLLFCTERQTYLVAVASDSGMPYWRVPLGPPAEPPCSACGLFKGLEPEA